MKRLLVISNTKTAGERLAAAPYYIQPNTDQPERDSDRLQRTSPTPNTQS